MRPTARFVSRFLNSKDCHGIHLCSQKRKLGLGTNGITFQRRLCLAAIDKDERIYLGQLIWITMSYGYILKEDIDYQMLRNLRDEIHFVQLADGNCLYNVPRGIIGKSVLKEARKINTKLKQLEEVDPGNNEMEARIP